jgi:hypothetical protein
MKEREAMSRHNRERRLRNYLRRRDEAVREALASGEIKRGTVNVLTVYHDEHCPFPRGKGPCSC